MRHDPGHSEAGESEGPFCGLVVSVRMVRLVEKPGNQTSVGLLQQKLVGKLEVL